LFESI